MLHVFLQDKGLCPVTASSYVGSDFYVQLLNHDYERTGYSVAFKTSFSIHLVLYSNFSLVSSYIDNYFSLSNDSKPSLPKFFKHTYLNIKIR